MKRGRTTQSLLCKIRSLFVNGRNSFSSHLEPPICTNGISQKDKRHGKEAKSSSHVICGTEKAVKKIPKNPDSVLQHGYAIVGNLCRFKSQALLKVQSYCFATETSQHSYTGQARGGISSDMTLNCPADTSVTQLCKHQR